MTMNGWERQVHELDKRRWPGATQFDKLCKLREEIDELREALWDHDMSELESTRQALADEIGDCMILLTMIAARAGLSAQKCAEIKFEDVRRRYGTP